MTMEGGAGVVPVMDLNRNNYGDGLVMAVAHGLCGSSYCLP